MAIIIPSKVNPLVLSYPDFTLGSIINPDEFDQNNLDIQDKLNEFINTINVTIDNTVELESIVVGANTNSTTALNTANIALANSTTAMNTANTAAINSANAVTTANTASANATTALNKATQVEIDYNLIKPELEQAVADVADKASVEYVDQVANDFFMGVAPDGSVTTVKIANDAVTEAKLSQAVRDKLNSGTQLVQYTGRTVIGGNWTNIPNPVVEYNSATDTMELFLGGIFQTPGVDYTYNTVTNIITIGSGTWVQDDIIDVVVYKNILIEPPTSGFDGALMLDGTVARAKLHSAVLAELDGLRTDVDATDGNLADLVIEVEAVETLASGKADFKTGTGTFTTGLTHTITDAFITVNTFVNVIPTGTKAGEWSVQSYAGSFTITSDTSETNCAFEWNALKAGV